MKLPKDLSLDFVYPNDRIIQCEAKVKDLPAGWRLRRYGDRAATCQRHALFNVNGKKLCRTHAGIEVLDLLMANHPTHFYRTSAAPLVLRKPGK